MSGTDGGLVQSTSSLMVSWGNSEGDTNMYVGNGNVTDIDDTNQNGVWKHYAVVRNGGTLKLYVNGKVAYSASNSVDMTGFRYLSISGYYNTNFLWKGYIQDFRIYGNTKYTSDFVVPSTSPDILPDTPSGVSGGSKLTKIIDGAVSFDGDDSLSIVDSTDFDFGSNNFCCELWFYLTTVANDKTFIGNYSGNNAFQVFIGGSGGNKAGMQLRQSGGTYKDVYTTTSIGANRWYHLACVREGSNTKVYLNGKLENTTDFGSGVLLILMLT